MAIPPNQAVAVRDFFYHRLRQGPPSAHVQQKLGNILELVGRPMRQQQNSPGSWGELWLEFFLHNAPWAEAILPPPIAANNP